MIELGVIRLIQMHYCSELPISNTSEIVRRIDNKKVITFWYSNLNAEITGNYLLSKHQCNKKISYKKTFYEKA